MDADHLDFFKDLDDIHRSFRRFAELLPADGALLICADTPGWQEIAEGLPCKVLTWSMAGPADYTAADIIYNEAGCASFTVLKHGCDAGRWELSVPGEHNISNALAVIMLGGLLDIPAETIRAALAQYRGTDRRFQNKGSFRGVAVVDDYAHHPTEIRATLTAAKKTPHRKLWCVFQPHTFSRTKALLKEFADALSLADEVILANIYAAREPVDPTITSADVAECICASGGRAAALPDFESIEKLLSEQCMPGDLVITMGAGDVYKIGEALTGGHQ